MLEEVWQDRGEMPEEEEKEAEREMKVKKAAVTRTKKANQLRREQLRVQAQTIERGVSELLEREAALRTQLRKSEEACAEEEVRRLKAKELEQGVSEVREEVRRMEESIEGEEAASQKLRNQLSELQASSLDLSQQTRALVERCSVTQGQLELAAKEKRAQQSKASERAGWYEQLSSIMARLAGVRGVSCGEGEFKYELPCNYSLSVQLGKAGEVEHAVVEPPDIEIADLIRRAVETNSIEFLLRETRHRIATKEGIASDEKSEPATWLHQEGKTSHKKKSEPSTSLQEEVSSSHEKKSGPSTRQREKEGPSTLQSEWSSLGNQQGDREAVLPTNSPPERASELMHGEEHNLSASMTKDLNQKTKQRPPQLEAQIQAAVDPPARSPDEQFAPTPSCSRSLASPTFSVADTEPRSEYRLCPSLPQEVRVAPVDARRRSRISFARAVSHPRSPCSRAARAGIEMDAKELLSSSRLLHRPQFAALNAYGDRVAELTADGTFLRVGGKVLGYIEPDGSVGGPELQYLGRVSLPNDQSSVGFVTDEKEPEEIVAVVDYGRSTIQTPQGSTVAELRKSGEVVSHLGASCGVLDGFNFHAMQVRVAPR